ncbi:MAG: histone-like protein [Promethearchaeota archaeon]
MAKKKSSGSQRTSYIAKAPIRRLMKNEGAGLVAEAAVNLLINRLTEVAKEVTKTAVKLVKDDKRKRITGADIIAASHQI